MSFWTSFIKYVLLIIVVFYLGTVVGFNGLYFINRKQLEAQQKEWEEALLKPYMEDTYGGKTPEETLQLFIDALKKNDIELASKYFVLDKQEKNLTLLREYFIKGSIQELIDNIESAKPTSSVFKDEARYIVESTRDMEIYTEGTPLILPRGTVISTIIVEKNANGLWKIKDI